MDGILLFDKPKGWTSHDAVDFVRRAAHQRTVGHAGTLDPMATGLLILMLGKATKRSAEFSGLDKGYEGSIRLGVTTETGDLDGRVVSESPILVSADDVRKAFAALTGDQLQTPPAFSAIKKGGTRAYKLAREGKAVVLDARPVKIESFMLERYEAPEAIFSVRCSKGTYIRSLAVSVGEKLGTGGTLSSLRRTHIGSFTVEGASTRETLTEESLRGALVSE